MKSNPESYVVSLIAGGVAGLTADVSLFPLDTIKTRLQSAQGFLKAGGFKNVYKGLAPQMVGSIPSAAMFFCSYDTCKQMTTVVFHDNIILGSVIGASVGEMAACLVRVPTEIIKQRRQVSMNQTPTNIIRETYRNEGFKGFYRGYTSTVLREIPFSAIQFPIWELLKRYWSHNFKDGDDLYLWESACCGAIAGGLSAFVTTPLDVTKTRIMLAQKSSDEKALKIVNVMREVYREGGIVRLFSGGIARTLWISIGGAIFLGSYDLTKNFLINR